MKIREYETLAMRTNDGKCNDRLLHKVIAFDSLRRSFPDQELYTFDPGELLNGALGLTGEAGEVSDMIKKHIFHGHDLDRDALIKEVGDVSWYLVLLCHATGISLEEVFIRNVEKLQKRYPEGFSEAASINREE